jgi:glutamyl-tRNA reductase
MKHDPNEDYDKWVERVRIYEYGIALQRIAQGEPTEKIIEEMSRRITDKLLHPWLLKIKEDSSRQAEQEAEESRKRYKENYQDRIGPVADHVIDEDQVDKEKE